MMYSNQLNGKRLLIIHNGGDSQYRLYKDAGQKLGVEVDQIADKPNEKAFGKIAGRLHLRFYESVLDRYYREAIDSLSNGYDYILVIRGEYTPVNAIQYLRTQNPDARIILYMWDSIKNNRGIEKKWDSFDKVYTFDRMDYLKHKDRIGFIPLFYCEEYISGIQQAPEPEYDIAFIGTAHGDRPKIVRSVVSECQRYGLKTYTFLYCPHILVYYYNKLFNKDYKGVRKSDLSFTPIPQKQIYEIYSKAKCVLDIEIKTQSGLTMRTMDILGLKKKLITTNSDIVNYDFYNEHNISILDRDRVNLDFDFIKMPYEELETQVYQKYSMKSWLYQLLQ